MRFAVPAPPPYDRTPPQPLLFVAAAQDKIFPRRCPAELSKGVAGLPASFNKPAAQEKVALLPCQAGSAEDGLRAPPADVVIPAAQDKGALVQRQSGFIDGGTYTIHAHVSIPAAQDKLGGVPCFVGCPQVGGPAHVSLSAAVRDPAADKKWEICESRSEEASSESSSIGVLGDSDDAVLSAGDDDRDDEEVQSQLGGGLGSLGSLEESLPIKRGLSNHFTGKSKSFGNLAEVSSVHELAKPDNPFNKRRRTLIACKWFPRPASSFCCSPNPMSMPVLLGALNEYDGQEDVDADAGIAFQEQQDRLRDSNRKIVKAFRSSSCFSLSDLQQRA